MDTLSRPMYAEKNKIYKLVSVKASAPDGDEDTPVFTIKFMVVMFALVLYIKKKNLHLFD